LKICEEEQGHQVEKVIVLERLQEEQLPIKLKVCVIDGVEEERERKRE